MKVQLCYFEFCFWIFVWKSEFSGLSALFWSLAVFRLKYLPLKDVIFLVQQSENILNILYFPSVLKSLTFSENIDLHLQSVKKSLSFLFHYLMCFWIHCFKLTSCLVQLFGASLFFDSYFPNLSPELYRFKTSGFKLDHFSLKSHYFLFI